MQRSSVENFECRTGVHPVRDRLKACPTDHVCPAGEPPATFAQWRERLIAAEQDAGWMVECDDAARFLAVSQELIHAVGEVLRRLAGGVPVLEVCSGSGELARALNMAGVRVHATDADPFDRESVLRMSAESALSHYRPTVVLGSFVPVDADIDEAVMACPSVQHYLVLNARIGGLLGSSKLWRQPGWRAEPLDTVRRWMLTRHDVWMGLHRQLVRDGSDLLRHGEAWLFSRSRERFEDRSKNP